MGIAKEHLFDVQEARFLAWAAENHPDVEEDTPEWETIGQYYSDWQDFLYEQALNDYEQEIFSASLNSVRKRCKHGFSELYLIQNLDFFNLPDVVLRMAWVHAISGMEACVMYSARALLNYEPHLNLFRINHMKIGLREAKLKHLKTAARLELSSEPSAPKDAYKLAAQSIVGGMTFHNVSHIRRYFNCMLHEAPDWPLDALSEIIQTRHDLVHRNGVTESDTEAHISRVQLIGALNVVTSFLEHFSDTMDRETAGYFNEKDHDF
ncbi:MAG: hypothetical protein FT726_23475 [Pantoea sp. Morm]|uniref:hypothetical protein n=1 Tax=Pantoea sp. Morm TaxID=2601250 RepID=UPI001DD001F3|nr:hypothetical protein [Pantoea sp. Morm]